MKFNKGDRVVNTRTTAYIPEGAHGTVMENSNCPWIKWDGGETHCRYEDYLEPEKELNI